MTFLKFIEPGKSVSIWAEYSFVCWHFTQKEHTAGYGTAPKENISLYNINCWLGFIRMCLFLSVMILKMYTTTTLEPLQRRHIQCFNKIMANLRLRCHVTPKSIFSKSCNFVWSRPKGFENWSHVTFQEGSCYPKSIFSKVVIS